MRYFVLLFISILPVYLVGLYIYNKDRDKEPKGLIIKLFFGGIGSFVLAILLTLFFGIFFPGLFSNSLSVNLFELFFQVFLGVSFVEELSKWIFVYKISYNNKEFDQIYDMIVYSVFVALGFACIENIFYVFEHGFGVGIIRGLLAVPGHACDGVFMGYFLSKAKLESLHGDNFFRKHYIFMSIFIPVLLHGFYDYCLFSQKAFFILLFFVFIIILYIVSIGRVKKVSLITRKIKYRNNYCTNCGHNVEGEYCTHYGKKNE